ARNQQPFLRYLLDSEGLYRTIIAINSINACKMIEIFNYKIVPNNRDKMRDYPSDESGYERPASRHAPCSPTVTPSSEGGAAAGEADLTPGGGRAVVVEDLRQIRRHRDVEACVGAVEHTAPLAVGGYLAGEIQVADRD